MLIDVAASFFLLSSNRNCKKSSFCSNFPVPSSLPSLEFIRFSIAVSLAASQSLVIKPCKHWERSETFGFPNSTISAINFLNLAPSYPCSVPPHMFNMAFITVTNANSPKSMGVPILSYTFLIEFLTSSLCRV